jgi:DNA-binding SARP family transcriptional activator
MWDLFRYLVTNRNRTIPPEPLIEALWPEEDYEDAKGALRTLIYRLRKALVLEGELKDCIVSVGSGYLFSLGEQCFLDAEEFEQLSTDGRRRQDAAVLKRANDLYRGDYLSDSAYAEWAIAKRSYYRRMFIENVSELVKIYRQTGELKEADQACEQALLIEPLDEHLNLRFLELLIAGGQYSRAQEHYTQFTARLYREMGIRPSPSLRSIYDMIKRGQSQATSGTPTSPMEQAGALICAQDVFTSLAEIEARRGERSGYSVFRADFHLHEGPLNDSVIDEALAYLVHSLRKGDALARQDIDRVSVLLSNITNSQIETVMNRLRQRMDQWGQLKGISINSTYVQL